MLDFVKSAFRGGINVLLWINLILCTIGGGIAGYYLGQLISYRNSGGYVIGGVLIGIICGLLTNIIGGGFVATILNIDENLEIMEKNLEIIAANNTNIVESTPLSQENTSGSGNNPIPINRNYGDTWVCKKCGEKNPSTSSSCKGCGAYK